MNPTITNNITPATIPYVAAVLLVDPHGRILLQHRDANAPVSPNNWTSPGGHMEPGESPEQTARREVLEETGLRMDHDLTLFMHLLKFRENDGSRSVIEAENADIPSDRIMLAMYIFYTATTATESDLILGEGQALAFKTPEEALNLDLALSMKYTLPRFLASPQYHALLTKPN